MAHVPFSCKGLFPPPPAYFLEMHGSGASGLIVPEIYHVGERVNVDDDH